MSKNDGAVWPYCETVEALEARARRRGLLVELSTAVFLVVGPLIAWQACVAIGTAAGMGA